MIIYITDFLLFWFQVYIYTELRPPREGKTRITIKHQLTLNYR